MKNIFQVLNNASHTDTTPPDGGNENLDLSDLIGKKEKQTTTRISQNQDGGAGDSISAVHGSQSPRISHPEGKQKLKLTNSDSDISPVLCELYDAFDGI